MEYLGLLFLSMILTGFYLTVMLYTGYSAPSYKKSSGKHSRRMKAVKSHSRRMQKVSGHSRRQKVPQMQWYEKKKESRRMPKHSPQPEMLSYNRYFLSDMGSQVRRTYN
ncbi:MAG: hypothetical protein HQL32_14885 [Planctomycetes bacterium]|nr:hypothetical protein [Planctomycetota bacterium]